MARRCVTQRGVSEHADCLLLAFGINRRCRMSENAEITDWLIWFTPALGHPLVSGWESSDAMVICG